jgi:hypothetical protein
MTSKTHLSSLQMYPLNVNLFPQRVQLISMTEALVKISTRSFLDFLAPSRFGTSVLIGIYFVIPRAMARVRFELTAN